MKIQFDGDGYNGKSVVGTMEITEFSITPLLITNISISMNTLSIPLTIITQDIKGGVAYVVVEYPTLTTTNFDYITYPDGGIFHILVEYTILGSPTPTSDQALASFIITKYASPHTLRTMFSIDPEEVSIFHLYNVINMTRDVINDFLSEYATVGSIGWDIGNIPIPISYLHDYYVAWYLMSSMHPTELDKANVLKKQFESILYDVQNGKLIVDNITPREVFSVIRGD